eukprot:SM000047S16860  [mRNA]  locus=s47:380748:381715:- [translate_table: standard]
MTSRSSPNERTKEYPSAAMVDNKRKLIQVSTTTETRSPTLVLLDTDLGKNDVTQSNVSIKTATGASDSVLGVTKRPSHITFNARDPIEHESVITPEEVSATEAKDVTTDPMAIDEFAEADETFTDLKMDDIEDPTKLPLQDNKGDVPQEDVPVVPDPNGIPDMVVFGQSQGESSQPPVGPKRILDMVVFNQDQVNQQAGHIRPVPKSGYGPPKENTGVQLCSIIVFCNL